MLIIKKTSNGTAKIVASYEMLTIKVFCINNRGVITQDGFLSFDDITQFNHVLNMIKADDCLDLLTLQAYGLY